MKKIVLFSILFLMFFSTFSAVDAKRKPTPLGKQILVLVATKTSTRLPTSTPLVTSTPEPTWTPSETLQYSLTPTDTPLPYLLYALYDTALYEQDDVNSALLAIVARPQVIYPLSYVPGAPLGYVKYNCIDNLGRWYHLFGWTDLSRYAKSTWYPSTTTPTPTPSVGGNHCYNLLTPTVTP